ncbi:MAG: tripartite tricarboxylate transporter TctB family protein [Cocleimonas sp.]
MKLNRYYAEWLALVFFIALVAVVFQQISTDLVDQGIASGDPFHNAAFYPRGVAILIIVIVCVRVVQLTLEIKRNTAELPFKSLHQLILPLKLVGLFSLYLYLLGVLGYHLTTMPFLFLVTYICGDRKIISNILFSTSVALLIAYLFENFLRLVLPGGVFSINIPW